MPERVSVRNFYSVYASFFFLNWPLLIPLISTLFFINFSPPFYRIINLASSSSSSSFSSSYSLFHSLQASFSDKRVLVIFSFESE